MRLLNNYTTEELEVLLECIRWGAVHAKEEDFKAIDKWADIVVEALSDAKYFEDKQLNF